MSKYLPMIEKLELSERIYNMKIAHARNFGREPTHINLSFPEMECYGIKISVSPTGNYSMDGENVLHHKWAEDE